MYSLSLIFARLVMLIPVKFDEILRVLRLISLVQLIVGGEWFIFRHRRRWREQEV